MNLKVFAVTLVFLVVVDFLWIGVIASSFYTSRFAEVGRIEGGKLKVIYWAGALVYLLLALGICVYVLPQVTSSDSMLLAFGYGALFGFICYGVYDCTNHATLKSWPLELMAVDIAWGTFVCGLTTCVARYAQEHWS